MNRLLLTAIFAPAISFAQVTTTNPLIDSVKTGGYVIVFRHAHTDRSNMERPGWTLADRSSQRNLSDRGASEAHGIGEAFKTLGIPVGEVLASPMFRTKETAQHAFGRADTTELLRERGSAPEARALLTRPSNRGLNRILVTHNAYLHRYFQASGNGQIGEGDAVVVRPKGDAGFDVLGRINLPEWSGGKSSPPGTAEHQHTQEPVAVADSATPNAAAAALLRAQFLTTFTNLHQKLLGLAAAIPAEKYSWRPAPGVRSVAEVYQHLLSDHFRGVAVSFGLPSTVIGQGPAAFQQDVSTGDKAELIRHLQDVGAFLKEKIGALDASQLAGTRQIYGRSNTIVWAAVHMSAETHEHLGQLIAYARMLGVVPPWSQ